MLNRSRMLISIYPILCTVLSAVILLLFYTSKSTLTRKQVLYPFT
jgi:hypothetical protein